MADSHLRVHGLSPGLNYGQQAFEGLKAFRLPGERGDIAIFRPEAHAARLQHSAAMLGMPPVPTDTFVRACNEAVARNAGYVPPHASGWSLYVRPLLFGSARSLYPGPSVEYVFCVYVFPMPSGPPVPARALVLDDFDRAAPRGTGTAKAGGNYAGVLPWAARARDQGFGITLHLDSAQHQYVDEFSLCGFLGVKGRPALTNGAQNGERGGGDVVLVVPDSPSALESLTSDSVQKIARYLGWKVEKRPVHYTELPEFDEVLGAGTAVGLSAIRSIYRRGQESETRLSPGPRVTSDPVDGSEVVQYIPEGQEGGGPVFHQLLDYLRGVQRGLEHDKFGWLYNVHE